MKINKKSIEKAMFKIDGYWRLNFFKSYTCEVYDDVNKKITKKEAINEIQKQFLKDCSAIRLTNKSLTKIIL